MRRWLGILGLALAMAGCASDEPIPTYPDMPAGQSLQILSGRARQIKTVSAQALVTLKDRDGQSVRFDAVIVMQPPDFARLRAWKLGQAVLDITLTPAGVWIVAPRDQISAAGSNTSELMRRWLHLMFGALDTKNIKVMESGSSLSISMPADSMTCRVDRATLTPRQYNSWDDNGKSHLELDMDHYAVFAGIAWPQRIGATSDSGSILVEMHDVEMNSEIPPGAFNPPARAEKLP